MLNQKIKEGVAKLRPWLWPLLLLIPLNIWLGPGWYDVQLSTLVLSAILWGIWRYFKTLYPKKQRLLYLSLTFFPNLYLFLMAAFLADWFSMGLQIIWSSALGMFLVSYGRMLEKRKEEREGFQSPSEAQPQPEAPVGKAKHQPYQSQPGEHRKE